MTKTEGELYLYVGDKASLNCTGKGGPDAEMTFQWFKNDETLPTNRYIKVDYPNKHSRLSFSGVNRSDVAVYRCRITSGDSVKESNFSLAVGPNCKSKLLVCPCFAITILCYHGHLNKTYYAARHQ